MCPNFVTFYYYLLKSLKSTKCEYILSLIVWGLIFCDSILDRLFETEKLHALFYYWIILFNSYWGLTLTLSQAIYELSSTFIKHKLISGKSEMKLCQHIQLFYKQCFVIFSNSQCVYTLVIANVKVILNNKRNLLRTINYKLFTNILKCI